MKFIETDRGLVSGRFVVRLEKDSEKRWSVYYFDGAQLEVARASTEHVEQFLGR